MADKARAAEAGSNGEYNYNCPIDQRVLGFLDISAEDFRAAACANPNDIELGDWVRNQTPRSQAEISAANAEGAAAQPETDEQKAFFSELLNNVAPERTDVETWFDLLDVDDEKSFGIVDLTRHAARSPYDKSLCGIYELARMADKGRASLSGTLGEYWYGADSGADRTVLEFLGVTPEQFTGALKTCPDDEALVAWIQKTCKKSAEEIASFNTRACKSGPTNDQGWGFYRKLVADLDPTRTELDTWFAVMRLDDEVTHARRKAGV
jgi:hypothetical protein